MRIFSRYSVKDEVEKNCVWSRASARDRSKDAAVVQPCFLYVEAFFLLLE